MSIKRFFREELVKRVIASEIRLVILAGLATIEPPIGPTVSQFGINASEFCSRFNILSSLYLSGGVFLSVLIKKKVNDYTLFLKGGQTSGLIRNCGFFFKTDVKFYFFLTDLFLISRFKFLELKERNLIGLFSTLRNVSNSILGTALSLRCTLILD